MIEYKAKCYAKINLFLSLTQKRADGFHNLQSLFAFLDLADDLTVVLSNKFDLKISGQFASFLDLQKNLFTEILEFFVQNFSVSKNLSIAIKKNIPVAAGLGGGSSNGASFIKIINQIFSLNLSRSELQKIALKFGSDLPFFFENQASIISGRGEFIERFPYFEPIDVLLINPQITLSTKEVFQNFSSDFSVERPTQNFLQKSAFELMKEVPNDLEQSAINRLPIIREILQELKNSGADVYKMSGSGATCFGVFVDKKNLLIAQENFAKKFPDFFIKSAKILSRQS